jgi:formamidopyrimidine-DNA glycosylase
MGELYKATRSVLQTAAKVEGDIQQLPDTFLLPHRDENRCPRCGGEMVTMKVSGRTSHYCPRCQS